MPKGHNLGKSQKARDIVEKFPQLSKKQLGKLLYKENPLLFSDEEDARYCIRAVTGAAKPKHGGPIQTDKYIGKLPEGEKNDFSPFLVTGKRIGILADIHIPYHDLRSLGCAINYLLKNRVDTLLLNGDIIDCYQLSRWQPDPTKRKHFEEVEMLHTFLDDLIETFDCQIIFKLGNHSERYERFIQSRSAELINFHVLDWKHLLNQKYFECEECKGSGKIDDEDCPACRKGVVSKTINRGIHLVKDKRIIKIGKLSVIHGHEFGQGISNPVNPARGFFLKAKSNVLGSHYHQISSHTATDINGKITGAWSTGCLCDLHPLYRPYNDWQHGFAFIERDGEEFEVHNHSIIKGKVK